MALAKRRVVLPAVPDLARLGAWPGVGAHAWANMGYFGLPAVMVGTNLGDQFASFQWLGYGMALAGVGAYLGAGNLGKPYVPPLPNEDWQARAAVADKLAQGRFVLHGAPRAKLNTRKSWFSWCAFVLGVGLFLGATWWRKQSELPHHDTGPLLMLAALLVICYGALWWAWRLRQRIAPKVD